jgi:hypothetical protein
MSSLEISTPSTGGRVFAFLAGLALLVIGALMSVGIVLVGVAGMGIATFAQRQRRARLSRWGGWIASTVSVAAVCAIIAFVIAQTIPANTWAQVKVAMDSASVQSSKQPPPAWIERMYPGMSERSAARRATFSPSTQSALMMAGFGMIGTFFVGMFGTLGWAAGMLLGFGARGRWPGAAEPSGLVTGEQGTLRV